MKNVYPDVTLLLLTATVLFYSCDDYNFSRPQPVDKENIYEFPSEYRGRWAEIVENVTEESSSMEKNITREISDDEIFVVHENYAWYIFSSTDKVVKGSWPKIDNDGNFIYPPRNYSGLKEILYDSLKKPIETVNRYFFRNNLIFEVGYDGLLRNGCTYYTKEDTFFILRKDTCFVDLGQNAMLRKLNDNYYALNIRNKSMGIDNDWWQLMILEIDSDKTGKIWRCSEKAEELTEKIYARGNNNRKVYFESNWTSETMLKLISDGYFECTSELVKVQQEDQKTKQ